MASGFDLAVLGADDPLGAAFLKALEDREIPVGRLYPLTLGEAEDSVSFMGEDWPCQDVATFDFGLAQAVVVASPQAAAGRVVERVRGERPTMPVLGLDEVLPGPAVAVARLLRVLRAVGGEVLAEAFVSLPVALAGKAGVDELLSQSRGLFNMESPDPEVFPLQVAFNVQPLPDDAAQRYSPRALAAAMRARQLPDVPGFSVSWAPLFYGAATALHARLEHAVSPDALRQALRHQEGVLLMESDLPAGNPTPATDSAESADIFLGQVRVEGDTVRLWLVYDPLRLEAEQMLAVVENWIEKPTNSVLT
ncbi:MAG: Asd/ArgC dimerization domain-containing protein [Pseudomonadota bacterium]